MISGRNAISAERTDAPDIDGKVFFAGTDKLRVGQYVNIRITDTLDYDLIGEVITDESAE